MAKKLYEESNIQAIADAIRGKNGETTKYKVSDMPTAISAIETGGGAGGGGGNMESGELVIAANSTEITIPVTSLKNHCLIVPKSFGAMFANHNKGAGHMVYGKRNDGSVTVRNSAAPSDTATTQNGTSYWLSKSDANFEKWIFNENNIKVYCYYAPLDASVEYLWFAW